MSQNKNILSIRVSSDGFFLSVIDDMGMVLVSKNVAVGIFTLTSEEIVSLFYQENSILDSEYNTIKIIVETNQYVLVPDSLFIPQETDIYFNFQHPENKNNVVVFNRIKGWGMVNIFSLPIVLNEALNELFPDESIMHQVSYIMMDKIHSYENGLYVWVRPDVFDAVVLKDKQAVLVNSYNYRTPEDFTYFTLSIFEQLNLDVENTDVKLYQREKTNEYQSMLLGYVAKCKVFQS